MNNSLFKIPTNPDLINKNNTLSKPEKKPLNKSNDEDIFDEIITKGREIIKARLEAEALMKVMR